MRHRKWNEASCLRLTASKWKSQDSIWLMSSGAHTLNHHGATGSDVLFALCSSFRIQGPSIVLSQAHVSAFRERKGDRLFCFNFQGGRHSPASPLSWKGRQMLSNPQMSMSPTGLRSLLMMSSPQNLRASGGHLDIQALGSLANRTVLGFQGRMGYLWHVLVVLHGHSWAGVSQMPRTISIQARKACFSG